MAVDPRLARKEKRQADRRAQLLDAARAVIAKDGARFTLSSVAAEAHLTTPALYYYFKDRTALTDALLAEQCEREVAVLEAATHDAVDGVAALQAMVRARVGYYLEHPEQFHLFYEGVIPEASAEVLQTVVYPVSNRINDRLEVLLLDDQKAGRLAPDAHPRKLLNVAFCTAQGILQISLGMARAGGDLKFAAESLVEEACGLLAKSRVG